MVKFDKSLLNHQSSTFWSHANQVIVYVEDNSQIIGDLRKKITMKTLVLIILGPCLLMLKIVRKM